MKLSEAILLGIGSVKNDSSLWLSFDEHPCGCAIGTAIYAAGKQTMYEQMGYDGILTCQALWPWTLNPSPQNEYITIASHISLKHGDGESREAIAAWIATIEPQDEPATVQATDVISTEVA